MFTIDVAMITMEAKSMIIYISMIAMVTRVVTGRGEGVMGAVSSNVSGRNARMGGRNIPKIALCTTYCTFHTHQCNWYTLVYISIAP